MDHWLDTARLFLRPFSIDDAQVLYELSREETLCLRMPDQVYGSVEEAAEAAAFLEEKALAGEWPFVLGIVLRETGELIGHVGLSQVKKASKSAMPSPLTSRGKDTVRRRWPPFLSGL